MKQPTMRVKTNTCHPQAGKVRNVAAKSRGAHRCSAVVRHARGKHRRGAAVVEFAVIAPLLFMLIFGMLEFGRLIMVQQVLTNASREGARRAVLEQASAAEVETLVADYLTASSVVGANVNVAVQPPS